jgi:hypothetical protein
MRERREIEADLARLATDLRPVQAFLRQGPPSDWGLGMHIYRRYQGIERVLLSRQSRLNREMARNGG